MLSSRGTTRFFRVLSSVVCCFILLGCQSTEVRKAKNPQKTTKKKKELVQKDESEEFEEGSNSSPSAITIDPIFGVALEKKGSIQKRVEALQNRFNKNKDSKTLIRLATQLVRNGSYESASRLARKLIGDPVFSEQAKTIIFISIAAQGQKNHAVFLGKQIAKSRKPWAQNIGGLAFLINGDYNEANKLFQNALRADPAFLPARMNQCSLFVKFGKADLASKCITQGSDASGNSVMFKTLRAMVEAIRGNEKKAIADLKALAKSSPNPLALMNLAYIYKRRGKESEAQLNFEKFRALFDKYDGLGFNALQRIDEQFQAIELKGARQVVYLPYQIYSIHAKG